MANSSVCMCEPKNENEKIVQKLVYTHFLSADSIDLKI